MTFRSATPLAILMAISFLAGWFAQGADTTTWFAMGGLGCVVAWCLFDARARQYRPSKLLQTGLLLLTVFALPCYLFQSRGMRAGALALSGALFALLAAMSCYAAGVALAA